MKKSSFIEITPPQLSPSRNRTINAMADPPSRNIVTKGNATINVINALGDINIVTSQLTSAINHLNDFVSETLKSGTEKRIILKQVALIEKASNYLKNKIEYIKEQSNIKSITTRTESRKRAASNLEHKLESKLKKIVQKIIFT